MRCAYLPGCHQCTEREYEVNTLTFLAYEPHYAKYVAVGKRKRTLITLVTEQANAILTLLLLLNIPSSLALYCS